MVFRYAEKQSYRGMGESGSDSDSDIGLAKELRRSRAAKWKRWRDDGIAGITTKGKRRMETG